MRFGSLTLLVFHLPILYSFAAAGAAKMSLKSSAFGEGEAIPREYTGEGKDLSPPLAWTGAPASAKELALIVDDPDAPQAEPWVHWVVYHIPPELHGFPAGLPAQAKLRSPAAVAQGVNSFGKVGYGGPMPPPGGAHRYFFHLYALDRVLSLPEEVTKKVLIGAMKGHIVAEAVLMGKYKRSSR